jgi:hypothetical protein
LARGFQNRFALVAMGYFGWNFDLDELSKQMDEFSDFSFFSVFWGVCLAYVG